MKFASLSVCVGLALSAFCVTSSMAASTPAQSPAQKPAPAMTPRPQAPSSPQQPIPAKVAFVPSPSPAPVQATQPMTASSAPALPALSTQDQSFYSSEAQLQREVRLLTLTEQVAAKTKKIASESAPQANTAASPVTVQPPPPSSSTVTLGHTNTVTSSISMPAAEHHASLGLVSVMSVDGNYIAVLFDHGARVTVHEGDRLSDGWEVTGITPTRVALSHGKAHRTVSISE